MPPRASLLEPTAPSNRDPLADRLARGRITQAQYLAAQEFRKHYGLAAGKMLTESYRALGADGSAVVHDMLINAMSAKEVAASRGLTGLGWEKFYRMRFSECLNTLAVIYGFSNLTGLTVTDRGSYERG